MVYHRLCDNSNMMGATSGAATAYHSTVHEFIPCFFVGFGYAQYLVFCVVLDRSLFVLLLLYGLIYSF